MGVDPVRLSKKMSYVLRHNPSDIGIELDPHGWVNLDVFVQQLGLVGGATVDRLDVLEVIVKSDKQRFQLVDDRIRAVQGHSIDIDLGLAPVEPPELLFHGTVDRFLDSIRAEGLKRGGRTHVHLSSEIDTATTVGSRRGKPVILTVGAAVMSAAGHDFFRSANGVWLADHVPTEFITFDSSGS